MTASARVVVVGGGIVAAAPRTSWPAGALR